MSDETIPDDVWALAERVTDKMCEETRDDLDPMIVACRAIMAERERILSQLEKTARLDLHGWPQDWPAEIEAIRKGDTNG